MADLSEVVSSRRNSTNIPTAVYSEDTMTTALTNIVYASIGQSYGNFGPNRGFNLDGSGLKEATGPLSGIYNYPNASYGEYTQTFSSQKVIIATSGKSYGNVRISLLKGFAVKTPVATATTTSVPLIEVPIQSVAYTSNGSTLVEVNVYSSKKAVLQQSYGRYRRLKTGAIAGPTNYNQLSVTQTPAYFFPTVGAVTEQIIQSENLPLMGDSTQTEVTAYSAKKIVIGTSTVKYGAYHRRKTVMFNLHNMALGAYWRIHYAEYKTDASSGSTSSAGQLSLGHACGQLVHLRIRKILPPDIGNWVEFNLFPTTYTSWPSLSSFSATLASKTIRSNDMNLFSAKSKKAVRLATGTTVPGGFQCDGLTDVSFSGSQVSSSGWSASASTNVAITGSQIFYIGWEGDGTTSVAITAKRIVNGTDFTFDSTTDCQITAISSNVEGFECDGTTDCEFTCERLVYGSTFNMDGSTTWSCDSIINWAGFIHCDGLTAVSITPKQIYTFGNTFNLDGHTAVAITASQAYGFGIEVTADGASSCEIVSSQKVGVSGWEGDGSTAFTCDTVADYNVQIQFDGTTTVTENFAYYPIVQIACQGVGDMFIDGLVGRFAFINIDGTTTCVPHGVLQAAGFLQFFTGIQTSVAFNGAKKVAAFINCDGSTSLSFNPNQDQFGEIQWGPMDQVFYCLGSFVFNDGAIHPTVTSSINLNSKHYPLGPDYIFGYIENNLDFGSPDFTSIPTMSFSTTGKTSRAIGTGYLGAKKIKKAVGVKRPIGTLARRAMRSDLTEEFIRFPLFVDEEIDFTQISNTIGFTLGGITSIAGYGVVGRDKEYYVTLGILTNTRLTQETLEILATGDPNVDVTQVCYEMLFIPTSNGLASQVTTEILYLANVGVINGEAIETLAAGDGGSGYINSVSLEMMHSIKARALASQATAEILATGDPEVQVSQTTTEMLYRSQTTSFSNCWIEQVSVEAIVAPGGNATIEQVSTEILNSGQGNAVINSDVVEIIHNNDRHAVINGTALEIINNSTTEAALCEQIAIEVLVRAEVDPTVASMVNNPRYHI